MTGRNSEFGSNVKKIRPADTVANLNGGDLSIIGGDDGPPLFFLHKRARSPHTFFSHVHGHVHLGSVPRNLFIQMAEEAVSGQFQASSLLELMRYLEEMGLR